MWLIGQATEEEIEEMKEQAWVVEDVEEDVELNAHDGDKLVAVFIDNDISKQLTKWYNEEFAIDKMIQKQKLDKNRRKKVKNLYEQLEMPEDQLIIETEDICVDGNHYIQNFYYEAPTPGEDSIKGTFHVKFKEGTANIIESYAGDDVPNKVVYRF